MASIIKSNTYADFNGREILTANNDGALTTQKILYPAFQAYIGTQQSISTSTTTKIAYDTEIFDTDNMYDATTNYRFTPTVAGKYFVYARYRISSGGERDQISIYKNGSEFARSTQNGPSQLTSSLITEILTLNGSSDYIEAYAWHNNGSTQHLDEGTSPHYSTFGAYRIGS
jgi:hypothetical protein